MKKAINIVEKIAFKNFSITSAVVKMKRVRAKRKFREKELVEANPHTLNYFINVYDLSGSSSPFNPTILEASV